jgi:Lon protease-like protein
MIFHVYRIRVRDNGLIVGMVEDVEEPASLAVAPEHGLLVTLLERLLEHVGSPHEKADRACFDDSSWVAFRLAELLPLDNRVRQEMLQLDVAYARLERLLAAIADLQDA